MNMERFEDKISSGAEFMASTLESVMAVGDPEVSSPTRRLGLRVILAARGWDPRYSLRASWTIGMSS